MPWRTDNPEDSFTDLIDVDVDQDGVFEQNVYASAAAMYTGTPGVANDQLADQPGRLLHPHDDGMAAVTGQPTYGTPDSDHDGYLDSNDDYPNDPYRF